MRKIDVLDYSGIDKLPKHDSSRNLNSKLKYINNEKRKITKLIKGRDFTNIKRN